jgi:hypothetical protein
MKDEKLKAIILILLEAAKLGKDTGGLTTTQVQMLTRRMAAEIHGKKNHN